MTDEELELFLDKDRNPYAFNQLSGEWKAWAQSVIGSAKIDVRGKGSITRDDAILYLCQITQVLSELSKGIELDELRGKFISGLVASGFPPKNDASFYFERALQDAQKQGRIICKESGWGSGTNCHYGLTLAGQRLAESVVIEKPSAPQEHSSKEQQNGSSPQEESSVSNKANFPTVPTNTPQRWYLFFRGSAGSRLIDGDGVDDEDTIQGLNEWHLMTVLTI